MKELDYARQFLRDRKIEEPRTAIVLGTGLHRLLGHIDVRVIVPYADIPGFPTFSGRATGELVYGMLGDVPVLIMKGRFHAYEGYSMQEIVFPVRVFRHLGVSSLLLTNAAGGISPDFKKGDLVMITDHINLLPGNPLTGNNIDELGPRFPDMSEPYHRRLCDALQSQAGKLNINLKSGVYAAVHGPNLETRAEYRYLRIIGADLVGMSTVPEVIAANHMGLPCAAVSVVTDECDPDNLQPVNIAEIIHIAGRSDEKLSELLRETVAAL